MSALAANKRETWAAIALMAAVVLAMMLANSPVSGGYSTLLLRDVTIGLPPLVLSKPVLHWINDGLMAFFFLLVGLEIKRECLVGDLNSPRRALLRLEAETVGVLARDAPLLGDALGALELARPLVPGEVRLRHGLADAFAEARAHRDPAHQLDSARDGDVDDA